ncbi:MAG: biotin--[acetyl-CoA-carboxylase] ligase [Deltaproteobacteria bacterium]|nr:biotin--[acetyl-CoA-carboxylase] ligase [Deltaproteobacteria bacterium]
MSAFDRQRFLEALRTQRFGRSLELFARTTSSMDEARRAAAEGAPHGHLILAEEQTEGRGSRGRRWSSPPGDDLYFSLVLRPRLAPRARPPLTLAIGLGVATAVSAHAGVEAQVKWPNDVWLEGRKCAGVLVEATLGAAEDDAVLVGVGVNVNRSRFDLELTGATSLALASDRPQDRVRLLAEILQACEERLEALEEGRLEQVLDELRGRLALRQRRVRCGALEGVLHGVAPDGALLLERGGRLERCLTGPLELAER